ncbi:MAG: FAD-dependent oxidoreductase [Patescibacteria group bacterium]
MTDLIIIGGGVAACSAGIFAGRRGLAPTIIAKDLGGQTASTSEIENYPGIGRIEGPELVELFSQQARNVGCTFIEGHVSEVHENNEVFDVVTRTSRFTASSILCAFGKTPKNLGVAGEERYEGKGIHYCNAHSALHYKDKIVAVVGGGNSALELVWKLSGIARHIYLIHRSDQFRAEKILLDRLKTLHNVEQRLYTTVTALSGEEYLREITLTPSDADKQEIVAVDGLFVAIGFESSTSFISGLVECDATGKIQIDDKCQTTKPGIFAAGDCTTVPYQQIIISAGEGAKAAISAYQYLSKKQGKRPLQVDWGFHA